MTDCFNIIDARSAQPALDKKRLVEFVIFNYYIGNADAHAKNISLLYKNGRIVLAPFYDLMSTMVYDGLTQKMAMKIDDENRLGWFKKRHFERLAKKIDVKPVMIINLLKQVGGKLISEGEALIKSFNENGLDVLVLKNIMDVIKRQKDNLKQ